MTNNDPMSDNLEFVACISRNKYFIVCLSFKIAMPVITPSQLGWQIIYCGHQIFLLRIYYMGFWAYDLHGVM